MKKTSLTMLLALVLMVTTAATPARASDRPDRGTSVVETTFTSGSSGGPTILSAGTWQYTIYLSYKIAGVTQWTYDHRITWTGNGTGITAYTPEDWSAYKFTGWSWSDTADNATVTYTSGGIQYKEKQTNGNYQYRPVGVTLIYCDPYIRSKVGGNSYHTTLATGTGC